MAQTHGYGSEACPWRIELQAGQRINITLIDFTPPTLLNGTGSAVLNATGSDNTNTTEGIHSCNQYAILTEKDPGTQHVRICGGNRRERNVYTSKTNILEIRIGTKKNEDTNKKNEDTNKKNEDTNKKNEDTNKKNEDTNNDVHFLLKYEGNMNQQQQPWFTLYYIL